MAVLSTEYRLPGVYSNETTGQMLGATVGGNATVALVGPALGYLTASQRMSLSGSTPVALDNAGVIVNDYSPIVRNRNNGTVYEANGDYVVSTAASGVTSIARNIRQLSVTSTEVSGLQFVFSVAEPSFSIKSDAVTAAGGYVIKGTVVVTGNKSAVYVEGTDYVIDYYNGTLLVKAGTTNITNGETLTVAYSWTTAEPIELVGETSAALAHRYISENGLGETSATIVSCTYGDYTFGDTPGVESGGYLEGTDFVVDYDTGKIARIAGSRIPSYSESTGNLMYVAFGYCGIKPSDILVVEYRYIDATYNSARYFANYNEFAAYFGNGWDENGNIVSPLTVAAYLATRNGMSDCYGVAVQGVSVEGGSMTYPLESWSSAFDALAVIDGIDIIVPLSGDRAVWALLQNHIETMKENEDERVAIVGAEGTLSADTMIALAQGLNDEDMWLISPSTFRARNIVTGVTEVIPAYYVAAGVAGYNSSVPQYMPLTHKNISGLYSANEYNAKLVKRNECANGLMYIDEVNGSMRILHGRTTSTESIVKQESNIVLTKYYIIKTMRRRFANGYIGSIITDDTLISVKSAAHSTLCNLRDANFLQGFSNVSVEVDSQNPTQVNISFSYLPTYSMNYIEISFSINSNVQ